MLTRMTERDGWNVPVCTQEQANSHCIQPVHFSGIILRIFVIDTIPSGTGGRDRARDVHGPESYCTRLERVPQTPVSSYGGVPPSLSRCSIGAALAASPVAW